MSSLNRRSVVVGSLAAALESPCDGLHERQIALDQLGPFIEDDEELEAEAGVIRLAVAGLGMMQTMMFPIPTYLYNDIEPQYLALLHWGALLMVLPGPI